MKSKRISWQNILVILGILVPQGVFFWFAHAGIWSIFVLAGFVFGWNFVFLAARFFIVRFIFEKKDRFREHLLVMFLTSNYLFFGFAAWVFMDASSLTYQALPYALLSIYVFVWLSQKHFAWEIFTFIAFALSLLFAWQLVVSLAFPGGVFAVIVLYSVFISAYNWGKNHKLQTVSALFFAFLLSLIVSEVGWVLLLWPIDLLTLSLIMFGLFYIFGSLALHSHKNTLKKRHVYQYLSYGLVYFVALCLTTEWTLPLQ